MDDQERLRSGAYTRAARYVIGRADWVHEIKAINRHRPGQECEFGINSHLLEAISVWKSVRDMLVNFVVYGHESTLDDILNEIEHAAGTKKWETEKIALQRKLERLLAVSWPAPAPKVIEHVSGHVSIDFDTLMEALEKHPEMVQLIGKEAITLALTGNDPTTSFCIDTVLQRLIAEN